MDENTSPVVKIFPGDQPAHLVLDNVQCRVLGALVEKQLTTPDNYPLTLNSLTLACNQLSNREPVVAYDEVTVVRGLNRLRELKLAFAYSGAESRTQRYGHKLDEVCELARPELAALTVLLLRGPQTIGEIRGRTGRMHSFSSLEEAEATLLALITRTPQPFALKLPRQPGTKESRYAHLLAGDIPLPSTTSAPDPEPATVIVREESERIARLEQEVAALRLEVQAMQGQFAEFRKLLE